MFCFVWSSSVVVLGEVLVMAVVVGAGWQEVVVLVGEFFWEWK